MLAVVIRNYLKNVFWPNLGVGRHDLNPQNSLLFLGFKSDVRLDLEPKSYF